MKSPVQSRSSHTSWWKMHEGGHPVITWCYKYSRRLRLCFCASHFHSLNIPWVLGAVYMISHFFNFKFHFILLYNTVLVLAYIDINLPRVYMSSQIELPYDTAIPLLGIHTKETRIERDTCTPVFIAALFIIARTWKQPRCPSTDEWIRKLWYIYTMEY